MRTSKRGKCGVVHLSGDEIATAIRAYLVARDVYAGPATTVTWEVDGRRAEGGTVECAVVVDPSSRLIVKGDLVSGPEGDDDRPVVARGTSSSIVSIVPSTWPENFQTTVGTCTGGPGGVRGGGGGGGAR